MGRNNADFSEHLNSPEGKGEIKVGDLVGNPNVRFQDIENNDNDSMDRKLAASKNSNRRSFGTVEDSLYDSIQKFGVKTPVSIHFKSPEEAVVTGGHHRIAAAHDIDPEMKIPYTQGIEGFADRYHNSGCPSCGGEGQIYSDTRPTRTCPTCMGNGI